MKTFTDRPSADAALPEGNVVCATLAHDGKPIYFHAPAHAGDSAVRALAFEAREGRPMSETESWLLGLAEMRRARA